MKTSHTNRKSGGVTTPKGFRAAAVACGIKASGQPDLALIVADRPCTAAGAFTTNKLPSAPVLVCREHLRLGKARAIICNSGNANAATGNQGLRNSVSLCKTVAQQLKLPLAAYRQVLPCSTGIIGRQLPMNKLLHGVAAIIPQLAQGPRADAAAARAIMTTDLVPKQACRRLKIAGKTVHLAGVCKGSGMIAPNMATMLAFLTTDAAVSAPQLRKALKSAVAASFNRISVDQHTSPSDAVLILASGAAGHPPIQRAGRDLKAFQEALSDLCRDLAYQIVRDGEGATRVFRVRVVGARTLADADRAGKAIVDSPLVKTAVHGADPNWGRITTAAGYSGAAVQPHRMSLFVGPRRQVCVYRRGKPTQLSARAVDQLHRFMKTDEVTFTLDLGLGKAEAEWLGCDLSRDYITINAEYTT